MIINHYLWPDNPNKQHCNDFTMIPGPTVWIRLGDHVISLQQQPSNTIEITITPPSEPFNYLAQYHYDIPAAPAADKPTPPAKPILTYKIVAEKAHAISPKITRHNYRDIAQQIHEEIMWNPPFGLDSLGTDAPRVLWFLALHRLPEAEQARRVRFTATNDYTDLLASLVLTWQANAARQAWWQANAQDQKSEVES